MIQNAGKRSAQISVARLLALTFKAHQVKELFANGIQNALRLLTSPL